MEFISGRFIMYGWMGKILWVDLATGKIEEEPLSDRLRLNYIGGRGINSRILYDSVGPRVDPLSPENVLIFGTGTLVGTIAPSAGRITATAKSPLTGILGDGSSGGHFSVEMKRTGYDHIVVTGKAVRPVYLWVENDHAELIPAEHLWGKTTSETDEEIHRELGDPIIKTASIGAGGENLVKYASLIFENCHAVGRTGIGAVMGSKNLKAVAVRGTKGVQVAHPDAFMRFTKELQERIVNSPGYNGLATYGTPLTTMGAYKKGWQSCKNSQTYEWNGVEKLDHTVLKRDYFVKELACTACPRHCNQAWEVRNGPYAGTRSAKIEYTAISLFGCGCLISDFDAIAKMNYLCDEYSIDILEIGNILNAAMEWYEKGLITKEDTDGIDLSWGNADSVIEMINKVARREGFGNLLAEGALRAAVKIGKGAEKYITAHSKGMSYGTTDSRALKGYSLRLATSTRGADHLRGSGDIGEANPSPATRAIYKEKFGTEETAVASSYDKATVTAYGQDMCALVDSLELCKCNTGDTGAAIDIKDLTHLFFLATGALTDEKAMSTAAARIYNVERAFLIREGITRKDDILGGKWGSEPIPDGPCKGDRIDPEKFDKLLDEYYQVRGWDSIGIPTVSTLAALGLVDIAEDIGCSPQ
jgi:aldehyde:ferredoxin oxidoreductase